MNQLPLEFKLFMNGAHVGYEKHVRKGVMEIWHSKDGDTWHCIGDDYDQWYIPHEQKMQGTGYCDAKKRNIYFGDRLFFYDIINNKTHHYTVILNSLGCIVAKHESIGQEWCPIHFENMELAK